MFKRVLTLVFVLISLFVPIKNADIIVLPENLTKLENNNLFENHIKFLIKNDDHKSLTISETKS